MKHYQPAFGLFIWTILLGFTCTVLIILFSQAFSDGYQRLLDSLDKSEAYLSSLPL